MGRAGRHCNTQQAHVQRIGLYLSYPVDPVLVVQLESMASDAPGPIPTPFTLAAYLRPRRHQPLAGLSSELRGYEHTLHAELIALINQEYPSFLQLVAGLTGVQDTLTPLSTPWQEIRTPLLQCQTQTTDLLQQLEDRLALRAQLRAKRLALQRMAGIAQSVATLERWLLELDQIEAATHRHHSPALGGLPPMARSQTTTITITTPPPRAPRPRKALLDDLTVLPPEKPLPVYPSDLIMKHLERIALEFNQVQYLVKKCPKSAFIGRLQPRIHAIRDQLEAHLQDAFTQLLTAVTMTPKYAPAGRQCTLGSSQADHTAPSPIPPSTATHSLRPTRFPLPPAPIHPEPAVGDRLTQCLRIYMALDRLGVARSLLQQKVVDPLLAESLDQATGSAQGPPVLTTQHHYAFALTTTLQGLVHQVWPVHLVCETHVPAASLQVFTAVVWPRLVVCLSQGWLGAVNNPGLPERFHSAYRTTMEFVDAIMALFLSPTQRVEFTESDSYRQFGKQWQLPAYFTICSKEILAPLDAALSQVQRLHNLDSLWAMSEAEHLAQLGAVAQQPWTVAAERRCYRLASTAAVWDALAASTATTVYLPTLATRFWKLMLQCMTRYNTWLDHLVEPLYRCFQLPPPTACADQAPVADLADPPQLARSVELASVPPTDAANDYVPLNITHAATLPSALRHDAVLPILLYLLADSTRLGRTIATHLWSHRLTSVMADDPTIGQMEQINRFLQTLTILSRMGVVLCQAVAAHLAKQAIEVYLQVRQITSQYRHTAKASPTTPSAYVVRGLAPLRDWLATCPSNLLPDVWQQCIVAWTLQTMVASYGQLLVELLNTLKRTEESLLKLRRAKRLPPSSVQGAATASDEAKIRQQITLDVAEFEQQLASFDAGPGVVAGLHWLRQQVQPLL
ncbi:hypothetical protein H4R34_000314 [Dimargaris verticillata]|uniref:Conserved oligomeric Golgi complex subunit 2 n=1 Tax=Dimargaris verticillata TaxID=2761393 RepID=A0A9W8BC31_9FUNG|nr:hypothetical protein H4R34_000314 [Dimargaris verticillata]